VLEEAESEIPANQFGTIGIQASTQGIPLIVVERHAMLSCIKIDRAIRSEHKYLEDPVDQLTSDCSGSQGRYVLLRHNENSVLVKGASAHIHSLIIRCRGLPRQGRFTK
jgi:hypothetical protein